LLILWTCWKLGKPQMNPRFNREVQKTTIKLLYQLAAVHKMPNVMVRIRKSDPMAPIELYQKTEQTETKQTWQFWANVSIPVFLSYDVPTAIASGGRVHDLVAARNKQRRPPPWDMEPLETDTVEQALAAVGFNQDIIALAAGSRFD
jgi:hypothetical protein